MRFLLSVILLALFVPGASAFPTLPEPLPPVDGNPADRTAAHRDHVHIGMTKAGAKGSTSFRTER